LACARHGASTRLVSMIWSMSSRTCYPVAHVNRLRMLSIAHAIGCA
jgi:hypothetical protein